MSATPSQVRIRMYNVGFGDCFLLTFTYRDESPRHVLIDFGTMGLPKRNGKRLHGTAKIANRIAADCTEGRLAAVVATHRHQDHISGFAGQSGEIIEGLAPDFVLQPWTEHPDLDEHATAPRPDSETLTRHQLADGRRLSSLNVDLERVLSDQGMLFVTGTKPSDELLDDDFELDRHSGAMKRFRAAARADIGEHDVRDLAYLGNLNIKNREAVERLMRMGTHPEYLCAGDATGLADLLPGVGVHVLGPPTAEEANIDRQAATHETEFWLGSRNAWGIGLSGLGLGDESWCRFDAAESTPVECRWLASHLARVRPRDLLAIVRDLDDALNNTSLILLFEIWTGADRRLLLFSGDAQLESWEHLFQNPVYSELLANVGVYKVGHHGSRNATPKIRLWERFTNRGANGSLVTLLSTCDGRHGDEKNDTEVPRRTLVEALDEQSCMVDTRTLAHSDQPMCVDCVLEPGSQPRVQAVAVGDP